MYRTTAKVLFRFFLVFKKKSQSPRLLWKHCEAMLLNTAQDLFIIEFIY